MGEVAPLSSLPNFSHLTTATAKTKTQNTSPASKKGLLYQIHSSCCVLIRQEFSPQQQNSSSVAAAQNSCYSSLSAAYTLVVRVTLTKYIAHRADSSSSSRPRRKALPPRRSPPAAEGCCIRVLDRQQQGHCVAQQQPQSNNGDSSTANLFVCHLNLVFGAPLKQQQMLMAHIGHLLRPPITPSSLLSPLSTNPFHRSSTGWLPSPAEAPCAQGACGCCQGEEEHQGPGATGDHRRANSGAGQTQQTVSV